MYKFSIKNPPEEEMRWNQVHMELNQLKQFYNKQYLFSEETILNWEDLVQALNEQNKVLNRKLDELQKRQDFSAYLSNDEASKLKKEMAQKDAKIQQLQEQIEKITEELEESRDQFDDKEDFSGPNIGIQLANSQQMVSRLHSKLNQCTSSHTSETNFLKQKILNLEMLIKAVKKQLSILNTKLDDKMNLSDNEIISQKLENLQNQLIEKEKIIEMNKKLEGGKQEEQAEQAQEIRKIQLQLKHYKEQNKYLQEKISNLEILVESVDKQNQVISQKLTDMKDTFIESDHLDFDEKICLNLDEQEQVEFNFNPNLLRVSENDT